MKKKRILIADSDAVTASEVENILGGLGYEVCGCAGSGREALQKAAELEPDLILMEIALKGGMDGIEAAKIIRDRHALPVVFLTGYADIAAVTRSREADPHGYVLKPVETWHLFAAVETALNCHELKVKLGEEEKRYRTIFQNAVEGVLVADMKAGKFVYANSALCRMFDYSEEELRQMWIDDIHPEKDRDMVMNEFMALARREKILAADIPCIRKDGSLFYADIAGSTMVIDGAICNVGFFTDVTERKKAGEAFRESEERFHDLIQGMPIGISLMNQEFSAEYVNPELTRITGYDQEDLADPQLLFEQVFPDPDERRKVWRILMNDIGRPDIRYLRQFTARCKDGSDKVIQFCMVRMADGRFLVTYEDVTERSRIEEKLYDWMRRFELMVEASGQVTYDYDVSSGVIVWGDTIERILGYPTDEIGGGISQWEALLHPDDRAGTLEHLEHAMADCAYWDAEYRLLHRNGRYVWIRDRGFFLPDSTGAAARRLGMLEDITLRKEAEVQIRESLREKETLLKEVHHRVKNNFQMITSLMSLQSMSMQNKDLIKYFGDAQNRIRSMALIHEKLYQSKDISHIDMASYLRTIVYELHTSYSTGRDGFNPCIESDELFLNIDQAIPCGLIINEILTNAFKYAFPPHWKGEPEMRISIRELSGMIEMHIMDNGVGMPESIDMNTTRSLGLSLVPMLAKQLSGEVLLDRSAGTRFIVRFPKK
ncbi:MAG: hypothetical protein A2176_16105 [Spirochaetes bacterium RBG_13_51_14]|nr:MAG: hypothetical protein A2176_16105 [Spirochaetes bacterium RBG_13_51_14]